jgi:REP element-mobilizing transposase RayT
LAEAVRAASRGVSFIARRQLHRAAVPPDVRKVFDLPGGGAFFGAMPLAAAPPDMWKVSRLFRNRHFYLEAAKSMTTEKFRVSRDTPAPYITIVAKDRLPVFQTDAIKIISCDAIDEARRSHGFLLFAYVIVPDHMHLLTNQPTKPSDLLRFVKGTVAHRVIDYLKENNYQISLEKLRHEEWKRKHEYSLWQQEKNVFSVFSEAVFMQKVNYIHQNPVRAGLVERAIDYRWSSARFWQRCETEDEPLRVDLDRIEWRSVR